MTRKAYNEDFKATAIKMVVEQGYSVAEAAKDLKIGKSTLSKWISTYKKYIPMNSVSSVSERELLLEKENRRLSRSVTF